jgi:predicted PurR-regulated permease PerM
VWTLRLFLPALGWGVILAVSLWPLHQAAARRWPRGKSVVLPAAFTLLVLLIFIPWPWWRWPWRMTAWR